MQIAPATGRYLVLLCQDRPQEGLDRLASIVQVETAGRKRSARRAALRPGCALVFERIGAAVVHCPPDKPGLLAGLAAERDGAVLAVEPERLVYATVGRQRVFIPTPVDAPLPLRTPAPARFPAHDPVLLAAYLQGYRDGVQDLAHRLGETPDTQGNAAVAFDESKVTWGIQAVGADKSRYTGKGIRVAILDTGLDLAHPDFAGRRLISRSFIEGQTAQDGNGHGTHCAGIAAGSAASESGIRYGVAGEAGLHIGKVLSDEGSGGDGAVLEGIDWAISKGCQIISMSLGSPVQPDQAYSRVFEEVARRALAAGSVIIAAAGNDSHRPDDIAPVSHPANCPSIMAVAALDDRLAVAPFSSGGIVAGGGEVDIAAPGVDILSSWPAPEHYNRISGTSMATPFVAGVAALRAQSDKSLRGQALLASLTQTAKPLDAPARDVGAGIVQAP